MSKLAVGYVTEINAEIADAIVLELLNRIGKTLGEARDRHTNLK
jgi:hypothetical protein